MRAFGVSGYGSFGDQPNLREGLVCRGCGLSNRNRLLMATILAEREWEAGAPMLTFERLTTLHDQLRQRFPGLIGTEYLGGDAAPGAWKAIYGVDVRHESITGASFATGSFDLVMHNDVLEHVFDYRAALSECFRLLAPGGVMIFTTPVFIHLPGNQLKATLNADGSVTHHAEPEYHGDPLNPQGALTFHHFAWPLVADITAAGFTDAELGVHYDPLCGLVSNNHPDFGHGNMLPIVLRGRKPASAWDRRRREITRAWRSLGRLIRLEGRAGPAQSPSRQMYATP
jgi:SAM-dependent methyltransferase